ncbi:GYD domain-containing protein [Caldovatus aquaticus]|uniref:GYD domain-containing protein n=1 Tax=Caldovatus aquaticus TaxID=2865671 RepID=A0ABS7F7B8_9PROT|nr:GYD domain-containing protein [Caldovatus aquaticus]MBW8271517.1 GYD domain-containing protein [Caldovatus aquaticus]
MPHYLMCCNYTSAQIRALTESPQDREAAARQVVEGFGGRLKGFFFAFGAYDVVLVAEFPDNESAAACSMRVSGGGGFSRFETHPLMTAQEALRAMEKAKGAAVAYRPPAG